MSEGGTEPSVSDARLIHLEAFKKRFDPMNRIGNEIHILVDTDIPPAVCLEQILLTEALWDGATRMGTARSARYTCLPEHR